MRLLLNWLLSALGLLIVSYFMPGFHVRGFGAALIAALVIGLVNATLGLFLKIITLAADDPYVGNFLVGDQRADALVCLGYPGAQLRSNRLLAGLPRRNCALADQCSVESDRTGCRESVSQEELAFSPASAGHMTSTRTVRALHARLFQRIGDRASLPEARRAGCAVSPGRSAAQSWVRSSQREQPTLVGDAHPGDSDPSTSLRMTPNISTP